MEIVDNNKEAIEQDKKLVQDFRSNPDNKKMAVELAHHLMKQVGSGWVNSTKLMKVFNDTEETLYAKITILAIFKLCAYKEVKGKQLYKIDIDQKTQRVLILQEIEFHKAQIEILTEKLTGLN